MKYVIGVDLGTSATKTILVDQNGKIVAEASVKYPMYQPENGWAEQDPSDWSEAAISTIKSEVEKGQVNGKDVRGIGISGQMHGLVMLNEENQVIRRSIIWCDQRTSAEVAQMNRIVGHEKFMEITANPALTGWTAAKILWVRNNEPENYKKCCHILLPKDYLRFILTGEYATDVSDASGMQLLNVSKRCWSKEICSLTIDDLNGNTLAIDSAKVLDKNNQWVEKQTKTTASTREIVISPQLADLIREHGYIYKGHPNSITKHMNRLQDELNMPHFSLHKLRHYFASYMSSLNIPEADILEMGGWETDYVMKNVYRHTMKDKLKTSQDKASNALSKILF